MEYSKDLAGLVAEAQRLKRCYLDFSDDPSVFSLDDNQEKIRIFQILFHAELECFFEKLALDKLRAIESAWLTAPALNRDVQSLIMYAPEGFAGNSNQIDPFARVVSVLSATKHKINRNHGVKEKNIYAMLLPTGIPISEFPSTLLPALNSIGGARGHLAHSSVKMITRVIVRRQVVQNVSQVLWDIRVFEKNMRRFNAAPLPLV